MARVVYDFEDRLKCRAYNPSRWLDFLRIYLLIWRGLLGAARRVPIDVSVSGTHLGSRTLACSIIRSQSSQIALIFLMGGSYRLLFGNGYFGGRSLSGCVSLVKIVCGDGIFHSEIL